MRVGKTPPEPARERVSLAASKAMHFGEIDHSRKSTLKNERLVAILPVLVVSGGIRGGPRGHGRVTTAGMASWASP